MLLPIGIYLGWEISHRGILAYDRAMYPMDPADEWRYTACSRLVAHGYQLFSQVYSAQPPLLFAALAAGMKLHADSIAGARVTLIVFGFVGILGAMWIAYLFAGRVGAAVAGFLLSVSPGFLAYAHAIEAEIPMAAAGALGLAVVIRGTRSQTVLLPLTGGLLLAAAVLIKLFALELLFPAMVAIVLLSGQERAVRARQASFLVVGTFVPVVLSFALLSPSQQWQQVIELHDRAAHAALPDLLSPAQIVGQFLQLDLGLTILAACSLIALALTGEWRVAAFLGAWLGGEIVMLLLFRPLFPHHPAILSIPLAVVGGVGVGCTIPAFFGGRSPGRLLWLLPLLAYLALSFRLVRADRRLVAGVALPSQPALIAWVERHSRLSQFVAVDDLEVADRAGRLAVPPLCDPSTVRLRSGFLTASDLIQATEQYRPAVVAATGVFLEAPGYIRWLHSHYRSELIAGGVTIYRAP